MVKRNLVIIDRCQCPQPCLSLILVPWKHFRCGLCYMQRISVFGCVVGIWSTRVLKPMKMFS